MRKQSSGLTLIELLVVVVIVSILGAIAVPSYRSYALRAGRAEAKATLLSTAASLERCYTRFNSYADAGCQIAAALTTNDGITTENMKYRIRVVKNEDLGAGSFKLTAIPLGGQANDKACGSLTLTSSNRRGPKAECWGR